MPGHVSALLEGGQDLTLFNFSLFMLASADGLPSTFSVAPWGLNMGLKGLVSSLGEALGAAGLPARMGLGCSVLGMAPPGWSQ